jgi:HK97 family phage major capsid protein
MNPKTLQLSALRRSYALDRSAIDQENRTVALAFSSEEPVDRFFGVEVLDHSASSVRLQRLADGGPVLVDHDDRDHVGTVEQASIDGDRKGRALVRFGRSARAEEIWRDVVDGIRKHVSVGYRIHRMKVEERNADKERYRVVDWEPLELSLVSIPADASVGVGRAGDQQTTCLIERTEMEQNQPAPAPAPAPAAPAVNIREIENNALSAERERVRSLDALGREFKDFGGEDIARQCISEGKDANAMRSMLLEKVGKRQAPNMGEIGLNDREKRTFSIVRLVNAISNPTDRRAQEAAAFEFECSQAALKAEGGRALRGGAQVVIPYDVLAYAKRDLIAGTSTTGGYTVGTDLLGASFIDLLKNRTFAIQAGATVLSGLQGHVAIPSLATSATAYWVAENVAPTEGGMIFGQVTLSPKTLGAYVDVSRRLMIQSSIDVENFVRGELASQVAVELDRVILNGAGTGSEPSGILASTSVGTTTAGANGGAPTWDLMVQLETLVANNNADQGSLAYFMNPKLRGKLKTVLKGTSAVGFIWAGGASPVNDYRAFVTNQVPSNLTKGTTTGSCSAAVFGNWSDVLMGQWGGGVDLMVDPYTGSNAGTVRIVALTDVDVAIRRVGSFAYIKDLTTT